MAHSSAGDLITIGRSLFAESSEKGRDILTALPAHPRETFKYRNHRPQSTTRKKAQPATGPPISGSAACRR
eukprot:764634-Hanusia_phi.AAC.6